jgi:hypothetical protein
LPKEITAKVTGAPKKPALAMKEVTAKDFKSATLKSTQGRHASASSKAPVAKTSEKGKVKTAKAQPSPSKKPGNGKR